MCIVHLLGELGQWLLLEAADAGTYFALLQRGCRWAQHELVVRGSSRNCCLLFMGVHGCRSNLASSINRLASSINRLASSINRLASSAFCRAARARAAAMDLAEAVRQREGHEYSGYSTLAEAVRQSPLLLSLSTWQGKDMPPV
jgi:outer membrane murein-binding lipoprotein Lpp